MTKYIIKIKKILTAIYKYIQYNMLAISANLALLLKKEDIYRVDLGTFNDKYFAIEFLGEIRSSCGEQTRKFLDQIQDREQNILIGYAKCDITYNNFINLYGFNDCLICSSNGNVGISVFDSLEEISSKTISYHQVKLRNKGADFTVAYVNIEDKSLYSKAKLNLLGRYGYDYVICSYDNLKKKKFFRNNRFKECRIFYSIGKIKENPMMDFGKYRNPFVTITIKYDNQNRKVAQEYYRPFYMESNHIVSATDNDENSNRFYNFIHSLLKPLHCKENIITIGDIFSVLKQSIPSKYRYMEDYTVNGICSRTGELAPGSVFFFRQQFNDNNDLKKQNEFLRLKLYVRAWLRRTRFVFSYRNLPGILPCVNVGDSMEAHIAVINYFRRKFIKNTQIIAITGSIGKTSTKDMVFNVLKRQFATGKSIRNSNVQVKIGLNIQNMKKGTEIFVQEVGGGRPGGASRHARMISPEIAVITNIGTAHIGNYNSQRELALNKLAITDGLCDEGTVFLNGDDSMLTDPELLSTIKQEIIYYGIENPKCDYYAQDIQETESGLVFSIYSKPDDAKTQCHLNVFGTHNVKNAVCAFAIGRKYGMETAAIVEGIAAFKTSETRQNLICVGPNRIFVDCYNASIDSVKSSLDTLESIGGLQDKRIAVLGDITGMGDKQEFVNEEVASIISKSKIDEFICYGKEGSSVVNKIKNINRSIRCTAIDKRSLLEEKITDSANKDTIILFKGSSKMRLDEIIDSIYGTALADQRYIDEGKHVKHKSNGVHYNLFEKYAAVSNMRKTPETYKMKGAILGKPVKIVCDNACKGNKTLKELIIGQNVCHIGKNSFRGCVNLEKVIIPESVKMIDQYAFSGCPKLTDIRIANNHIYIDQSAFDESAEKGQE